MLNSISSWFRRHETVRELNRLSDRELADLGIDREEIRMIVSRASGTPSSETLPSNAWDALAPSWAYHNRRALAG